MHAINLINKIAYCTSVLAEKWDFALLSFVMRKMGKIIVLIQNVTFPKILAQFMLNLLICYPHHILYAIQTSNYHMYTLYILESCPNFRGIALLLQPVIFSQCVHLRLGYRFHALFNVCSDCDDTVPLSSSS